VLGVAAGAAWWAWAAPSGRLPCLAAGLILSNYLLIYSARAAWGYDDAGMHTTSWSRYHLLPQLGVALLAALGLPRLGLALRPDGLLTRRQARGLAVLLLAAFVVQLPRGLVGYWQPPSYPGLNPFQAQVRAHAEQQAVLRRVEEVSRRCREQGLSAEAARRALPEPDLPDRAHDVGAWDLLRGSPTPREVSADEARRLLDGDP
jgi:hypothetical protein